MVYYHGTDKDFKNFELEFAQDHKDFGAGIYLSEKSSHAEAIARRRNSTNSYIRAYELDINEMRGLFRVKEFKKPSIDWAKFVLVNRNTAVVSGYDIVIGPTADADAQKLLEKFYNTHRSRKATIKEYNELRAQLMAYRYPRQMCILSNRALSYVNNRYIGRRVL